MKNNSYKLQLIVDVLDSIQGMKDIGYKYLENNQHKEGLACMTTISEITDELYMSLKSLDDNHGKNNIINICDNLNFSVNNIKKLIKTRSRNLLYKIEFELDMIIRSLYNNFYYFYIILGDFEKEEEYYSSEFSKYEGNHYIDSSMKSGIYKYDVSIYVCAFNKLDYTKVCIESILENTPKNLNYELIVLNNGSTDGTAEYFDSLNCTKTIHFKNNIRGEKGVQYIFEGKYLLGISNDIVVTKNYLENLLKCIESEEKIGMVVPATPNISNFQTLNLQFTTLDEMKAVSADYNISDYRKWEERARLCNAISLNRSDILLSSSGVGVSDRFFIYSEFEDDALSLRLRRKGFKLLLAKDCYCYHYGSITLKDDQIKNNTLEKSRLLFFERYGVDAWGTGFTFDPPLIESINLLDCENNEVSILGINSGFGSNPLQIKNEYKKICKKAELYYVYFDETYIKDVELYANDVRIINEIKELRTLYNNKFNKIIIEDNSTLVVNDISNLIFLLDLLKPEGELILRADKDLEKNYFSKYNFNKKIDSVEATWYIWVK